jgi:hypothetical protein
VALRRRRLGGAATLKPGRRHSSRGHGARGVSLFSGRALPVRLHPTFSASRRSVMTPSPNFPESNGADQTQADCHTGVDVMDQLIRLGQGLIEIGDDLPEILQALRTQALNGNVRAMELVLLYTLGEPYPAWDR